MSSQSPSLLVHAPEGSCRAAWVHPADINVDRHFFKARFRVRVVARDVIQGGVGRHEAIQGLLSGDAFGQKTPSVSSSAGHHGASFLPAA